MAKRKRKLKLKLNLKAIGIGALALLLAGGLIYGQRSLSQKTQVEEQAKGLFGPRCQDRESKDECTSGGCMDNKTSCRWDSATEECKKKGDSSCGGGGGNPGPNPSGSPLPRCESRSFDYACSRDPIPGGTKCLWASFPHYCCSNRQIIKNGRCVPIPTCGEGLYCTPYNDSPYLIFSDICIQKGTQDILQCCPKGDWIKAGKCVDKPGGY